MRSPIARSLEPIAAILGWLLLAWTLWTAAVWGLGIDRTWLGFGLNEDDPLPPNADLRSALAILAANADLIWLVLATANLHLIVSTTNGLRTARAWLGFSAGGAFLAAMLSARTGLPFGHISFGSALGGRLWGVAAGWVLLWPVLIMSAREATLWLRPRLGHGAVTLLTALAAGITLCSLSLRVNVDIVGVTRPWWFWHGEAAFSTAQMPWWCWLAWFVWPALTAFAMREKDVISASAHRSWRPAAILAALNFIILAGHAGVWLRHG